MSSKETTHRIPGKRCCICKNDISMQKTGSKICSVRVYGKDQARQCQSGMKQVGRIIRKHKQAQLKNELMNFLNSVKI